MPLVRLPTTGSQLVASANVYVRRTVVIPGNTNQAFWEDIKVQINNLPNVFVWIWSIDGGGSLSFFPTFAVDNVDLLGVTTPKWLPLTTPQAVFPNTPSFFSFRIVATMLTLGFIRPLGDPDATVQVVIGASQ